MKVESIVKTIPADTLAKYRKQFAGAGIQAASSAAKAYLLRVKIINDLMDIARTTGVAAKVAIADIMREVVKPCARTKDEQIAFNDMLSADIVPPTELAGKLSYSAGHAYKKSMELAFAQGKPFTPSLYAQASSKSAADKKAAHAEKVRAAEIEAEEAAKAAKAAATKAAKSKSEEAKLAAAQAKLEAEKANEAVRKAIDAAPISQKTGGRKKTKVEPAKVLTRHEVAMHATRLVSMLRDLKEPCADEIADILAENNLLVK